MVTKSIRTSFSPESARLLCQRRNIPQKPFRALRVPDLTVKEEREYWAALMVLLDGSSNRNDTTRELVDGTRRRLIRTIGRPIPHSDDDLALRTPSFNVGQGILRLLKRKNFVDDWTDYAGFDQGSDLVQLLPLRSHEQERIAYAKAFGFLPHAAAQQVHHQSQKQVQPVLLGESGVGRTRNRNEQATRPQHAKRFLKRLWVLTVQDEIVA